MHLHNCKCTVPNAFMFAPCWSGVASHSVIACSQQAARFVERKHGYIMPLCCTYALQCFMCSVVILFKRANVGQVTLKEFDFHSLSESSGLL